MLGLAGARREESIHRHLLTYVSLGTSILAVLFLAMSGEPYALSLIFVLLVIKTLLFFKITKVN